MSVIDTATDTVQYQVYVGDGPYGVAVSPDGNKVYVTHYSSNAVSVIDAATNNIVATVPVGSSPYVVEVNQDGTKAYVTNSGSNTVSVIDTITNTVTATVNGLNNPHGVAIAEVPDRILPVANFNSNATEGSVPLDVQFTNLSTNATDLQWNFGDGSSNESVPNPEHIFTSTGSFNVVLTASNANGSDSKSMAINVQKATPIITWSNLADITYGTALSRTQLNAVASVPGTYVYTPAAGSVLPIGTQTLHVDFTPSDTANYNVASRDVTINVISIQKTDPTITWNNPADIAYGTPLSSKQLNAKASVTGNFVYTPAVGTKLPVGAQTLKVVFTPKNAIKYATATKTVTINVQTVPLADFSASTTTGKAPLPVTFTDKSTGSPTTWTWKFGDGGSLTSKIPYVPVHTYTKKGKYTISLTAKNVAGSSTKTMSITVK
jgi:YVTN family beta-propeller protein